MKWNAVIRITSRTALSSAGRKMEVKYRRHIEDLDIDWDSLQPDDRRMILEALDPAHYESPLTYCPLVEDFTQSAEHSFCDEPECEDCDLFSDRYPQAIWVCYLCREKGIVNKETREKIEFNVIDGFFAAEHCAVCQNWAIALVPILLEVQDK